MRSGGIRASSSSKDLLVVGPGVLGRIIAQKWREENKQCRIVGQTKSTDHHEELKQLGIDPAVRSDENSEQEMFPYVVFCAPPSGSQDYPAEVRMAAQRWNGEGSLLFTSSSAVYDRNDNGPCDESTPVVAKGKSPRTDVLLHAEEEALKAGGNVVRLAGLYISFEVALVKLVEFFNFEYFLLFHNLERGAHVYWLKLGTVDSRPDHIINLIHYDDAASLCVAILNKGCRGQVFIGCDGHPMSRQEIMDAINNSPKFGTKFISFTASEGPLGKKMSNPKSSEVLNWQPAYKSFAAFMQQ